MGQLFLKIAVVYLFIGVCVGFYMGITGNFVLAPVHAHLLLLGWATLALAGVIYHLYPAAAGTRLAKIHCWLHNLGLPVFMVGLGSFLVGHAGAMPVVIAGATAALIGLAFFMVNVLLRVKSS